MDYIGMDVHKKHTVFCVVDETGQVVSRGKVESTEEAWREVLSRKPTDQVRLVFETGTMAWWLVAVAREAGIEPTVVDVRHFKLLATSKKKSDRRDAFLLADAGRTGIAARCAVVVPSDRARRGRSLLQARSTVKKQAIIARNAALGLLRSVGVLIIGKRQWRSAERWEEAVALPAVPIWMTPLLKAHRTMWTTADEICRELEKRVTTELAEWPSAAALSEIPGYGPLVTLGVLCTIDDPTRFRHARQAGSYAGLAPKVRASGETTKLGRITREGSPLLRHLMVQGAMSALRSKTLSPGLRRWAMRLVMKRGRSVAAVALARRLLTIGVKLLKTGEVYDPTYGAEQLPATA